MRIAMLGAGGIGGYYGGLLARAGHDVAFVARGAHLAALQQAGLRVESVHGDFAIEGIEATDDPAQVGIVDLVLVTVKSYDLDQAAEAAHPLLGPETVVLPLLNGLDAADRLADRLGQRLVLAGLTHISSSIASPGLIRQVSPLRRITLGERDGTVSARAERVRDALSASGIEAVLTPDINVALWEKFLFIASISGICCLARQPIGPVMNTRETRELYLDALREIEALARARQVGLASNVVERTLQLTDSFDPQTRPSMLVDLQAGRRLELDALSGTVVRYGQETGVATPLHRVVYAVLKPNAT